jgi:hypothetical protein
MTRERKATLTRRQLDQLQGRYLAAQRLSRRNEMARLGRDMNRLTLALLKLEIRMEKAA